MTEDEWVETQQPLKFRELQWVAKDVRQLRLLMVGLLEPLEALFSAPARAIYDLLRESVDDGASARAQQMGELEDSLMSTPQGKASGAVSWIVNQGYQFDPKSTYDFALTSADVCSEAAQALVLQKVGKSPKGLTPTHPWHQDWHNEWLRVRATQTDLMRCVFGNPFSPSICDNRWLTSTVIDLAQIIYDERKSDRMPILADALMDAGCDNDQIIHHCRSQGPHARGCWVVDLLLSKR